MKKTISILTILILLFMTGCANTELLPPENPVVLIGNPFLSSGNDDIGINMEVELSEKEESKKENLIDTKKSVEIMGAKIEGEYFNTLNDTSRKNIDNVYVINSKTEFQMDKDNKNILGFLFHEFPEGYNVKTEPVDVEKAKEITVDFLTNEMGIDIENEFQMNEPTDNEHAFYISFDNYVNGIRVKYISIIIDKCGNIWLF